MATTRSFVKLYRSILDWEWYDDAAAFRLFLHLMLKANYVEGRWHGQVILPGQHVTSTIKLAQETGLSRSCVVRTMNKLKKSGEVDSVSDNNRTLVTLVNWAKYQGRLFEPDNKPNSDWTATGHASATIEEVQKERTEEVELRSLPSAGPTVSLFSPSPAPEAPPSPRSAAPSSPPVFDWPAWAGPVTKARWEDFKAHKWAHHKFKYRTEKSEQAAINLLGTYFPSGKACVEALDEAMAKGWMFPPDPAKERAGGRNEESENDD